jgi:hypothetical protein
LPRARQLQLIKDAEFHDVSPATGLLFSERVYSQQRPSPTWQVQRAKSSMPSPAFRYSAVRKAACAGRTNG